MSLIEDFDDIAARLRQIEREREAAKPKPDQWKPVDTVYAAQAAAEDDTKWIDFGPYCC